MAEFYIVVQGGEEAPADYCVYSLEPRAPFVSRRRESAFWSRTGEEVADAAALAGLPFESAELFLKRARRAPGKRISLCRAVRGEELVPDGEAAARAAEIAERNRAALPDAGEEMLSAEELEAMLGIIPGNGS